MARLTLVPFLPDGRVVLVDDVQLPPLPTGEVEASEHYLLDTARRVALEGAGYRPQRLHELVRDESHIVLWAEGDQYRGRRAHRVVDWRVSDPAEASAWLRAAGRRDDATLVDDAARSFATQTDASYYDDAARQLGPAYLRASTPEAQSGFGGTSGEWRAARQPIADAITRDGTFLDVGCANGLLMESVRAWCGERSLHIEPYGVDLVPELVDLARERLPQWRDRVWVGNAVDWVHPDGMRFDAVRIGLGAVPATKRRDLVAHHLERVVAPGGRLIVCHYVAIGAVHVVPVADALAALGFPGATALAADVAWLPNHMRR